MNMTLGSIGCSIDSKGYLHLPATVKGLAFDNERGTTVAQIGMNSNGNGDFRIDSANGKPVSLITSDHDGKPFVQFFNSQSLPLLLIHNDELINGGDLFQRRS